MSEPLDVKCPFCQRRPGWPCSTMPRTRFVVGRKKPHAARVSAAEKAGKEKSNA